ncbi:hypothetical protein VQ042_02615 [Aurantimonas sp. A2-1-M11]|uniref:hypothetical protein n=1 Tax=Aurantimonas sp. A2-1-M11 TaxID=3113712 RepID=UPI002F9491E5
MGQLRSEREGYRSAYEEVQPRLNYLRMVTGPVSREEIDPSLMGKPSIMVVTLPKSGTVYITQALRQSLGYDFTSVMVTPTFPKNIVWESMAVDFAKGGMVSASHMEPDVANLAALKYAGIDKAVVHFRDRARPLQAGFTFAQRMVRIPPRKSVSAGSPWKCLPSSSPLHGSSR